MGESGSIKCYFALTGQENEEFNARGLVGKSMPFPTYQSPLTSSKR